jgi:magnesium transporter
MNGVRAPAEQAKDVAAFVARLADERAADIVDVLNEQTPETAAAILLGLPQERAVEVLDTPGLEHIPEIVIAVPRERAMPLLSAMSADRLADLFRELRDPVRSELLQLLGAEVRATLQQLLAYPPESVGTIMTTEIVAVPATWTVEQTLHHIRLVERARETVLCDLGSRSAIESAYPGRAASPAHLRGPEGGGAPSCSGAPTDYRVGACEPRRCRAPYLQI